MPLRRLRVGPVRTVTTDTSCGAVNSMHDSFMPLGGLIPLVDMQLGEIIFGGVGSGLYGMIVFVVLDGLHRRPHGRPHAGVSREEDRAARGQFAILAALVTPVLCLVPAAIAAVLPAGLGDAQQWRSARLFGDPLRVHVHERQQRLGVCRARTKSFLQPDDRREHVLRPLCRGDSRARAGGLARREKIGSRKRGTFTTHSPIFVALLIGVIVIVGALTFLPADSLGPIVEHLLVLQGKTF